MATPKSEFLFMYFYLSFFKNHNFIINWKNHDFDLFRVCRMTYKRKSDIMSCWIYNLMNYAKINKKMTGKGSDDFSNGLIELKYSEILWDCVTQELRKPSSTTEKIYLKEVSSYSVRFEADHIFLRLWFINYERIYSFLY